MREKWIAALRSGEYKQTKGTLKNDEGFCCLGVAAQIDSGGSYWTEEQYDNWIALKRITGLTKDQIDKLIDMNDGIGSFYGRPQTFSQIADVLESMSKDAT